MPETGIHDAQLIVLLLLLFVAVFAALARRLKTPYPIVLVIAGLLLSLCRGYPESLWSPT
jgi:monovalent cation/hydrogen antiporter